MQSPLAKQPSEQDLTGLIQTVTQADFLKFTAAPYAIVRASNGASPQDVHPLIAARYGLLPLPLARLGVMDLSKVEWTLGVAFYAGCQMKRAGIQPDSNGKPPAGYYLFANGVLLGFHDGKKDPEKDRKHEEFVLGANLFHLMARMAENESLAELSKYASRSVATLEAAQRVIATFDEMMKKRAVS